MSASPRNHSRSVSPPRSPRNRDERSPVHSSSPRGAEYDREPRGEEVHNPGSNLYISGLSTRTSEEDLRAKFSKCGKVIECSLVRDRDGNPRGFGFVRMETVEQADAAIADLNREEMNGYQLRVEKAKRARPRDPTPGRYLGNDRSRYPRARSDRSYGDRYSGGDRYSSGGDRYGGDRYDDRYRGSYGSSSSSSSTSGGGGDRYDDRYRGSYSSGGDRYGGDRYDDRYRGSYAPAYDHAPRPEYSRSSRYQPYERRSPPAYRRSRSGSR